ncbi:MAG: hypothetical protein DRP47_12205 [Candidatus Zixiibacteriota bacterium]|nr:MAG: hypothetical protein DRP47_12205 [candidate division Zixibacteria bacterium]
MGQTTTKPHGNIVKDFLIKPLNRKYFDNFYRMCYVHTVGFLRYLKIKGYQIPAEQQPDKHPFADLAIDILGTFLQSTKEQPYWVVFDYFSRKGIDDISNTDDEELYHQFRILLQGYVRKELSRLRNDTDPQIYHLKKRFKDILKESEYVICRIDGNCIDFVSLQKNQHNLRDTLPPLSYENLTAIVEEAYLHSSTRNQWCQRVFELVDSHEVCQNFVKKHELLSAAVAVNLRYCDLDGLRPSKLTSADHGLIVRAINEATSETLDWMQESILDGFVKKKRITKNESNRFQVAFEQFITDLAHVGEVDLLPAYFREVMPDDTYDRYLKDYKYVFETAMNKAEEEFKSRLKKKSTLQKYRGYL